MSVHAIADMRTVVAMGCMILYVYVDECQCCCIVGQCVVLDDEQMERTNEFWSRDARKERRAKGSQGLNHVIEEEEGKRRYVERA